MIFRFIVWIILIAGGIAGGIALDDKLFNNLHINLIFHILSILIGVVLLLTVVKISKNTGRTLAKYGRKGKLKRGETNVLVKKGPYKYMRHPMHLGLMIFPFALAFLTASPSFLLIIAPAEILFMLVMIKLYEEPGAIKKFGGEYLEYKKHVPGFCLRTECIKELFRPVKK